MIKKLKNFFSKQICVICLEEERLLTKSPCCNSWMHSSCKNKFINSRTIDTVVEVSYQDETRLYQITECPCCRFDRLFNLNKLKRVIKIADIHFTLETFIKDSNEDVWILFDQEELII